MPDHDPPEQHHHYPGHDRPSGSQFEHVAGDYDIDRHPADVDQLAGIYHRSVEQLDHAYAIYRCAVREHDTARVAWVRACVADELARTAHH